MARKDTADCFAQVSYPYVPYHGMFWQKPILRGEVGYVLQRDDLHVFGIYLFFILDSMGIPPLVPHHFGENKKRLPSLNRHCWQVTAVPLHSLCRIL